MNTILAFVQKQQLIAVATAASGIASTLLTKGTTAHSHFKFLIPIFEDSTCLLPIGSHISEVIKKLNSYILMKYPLLHHHNLEVLD